MDNQEYESSIEQPDIYNVDAIRALQFAEIMFESVVRSIAKTQYDKYLREKCPPYTIQNILCQISTMSQSSIIKWEPATYESIQINIEKVY